MSIFGYVYGGLTGVGISYLIYYIVYLVGIKLITNNKYSFTFSKEFYLVLSVCVIFCFGAFLATYFDNLYLKYALMLVFILSSSIFSVISLDKKTNLIKELKQRIKGK